MTEESTRQPTPEAIPQGVTATAPPPRVLLLESTNACNSACPICPHSEMTRPVGVMSIAVFERLLAEAKALGVPEVRLHLIGEAFLDPNLEQKVRRLKETGFRSAIFTNGSRLTPEVLGWGLDELTISFAGPPERLFRRVHGSRLDYQNVLDRIAAFLEAQSRSPRKGPAVTLTGRGFGTDREAREEFIGFWSELKTRLALERFSLHCGEPHDWAGQVEGDSPAGALEGLPPCPIPWHDMHVQWDGEVTLCCLDYDGMMIVGNAAESGIAAVWNGPAFRAARQTMLTPGRRHIAVCRNCTLTWTGAKWKAVADAITRDDAPRRKAASD